MKEAWLRSKIASRIALGVLALAMAWVGFQLGTHRHTGISRQSTFDNVPEFLPSENYGGGITAVV